MVEFNYYPVFVADQVLTADHLNEIVNYLEEQDRLTRNKLIGIGIVCGLELKVSSTQIEITKGCGVTSAGYLIVQDALTLTHYRPYTLPGDFSPRYKSIYKDWDMWELLTAEQVEELEDGETIKDHASFMKDKIVVLLLEMSEVPLKNCIDTDCDDKGEKIQFAVKPLLVDRDDIDAFLKGIEEAPHVEPKGTVEAVLSNIELRRFNVPVSLLLSTDAVLNAFLQLVDEPTLKRLAEVLNYCYVHYKPILTEDTVNPFATVFELFKERLASIKKSNPFFIQYYYDWIDDLIKAYYEFKGKVFDVQMMCCPDEDLFPLHLMLGEATKSTVIDVKSKYRHYFIYSPLFNQQKDLLVEVQLLFRRMKLIVQNYTIPDPKVFANATIKITPSKYLDKPLSSRCIPYYYNPLGLYQTWSWNKTRKGNARYNLSYNASQYNTLDSIVNPLKYDIERFNFFRVEGHIGKNYTQAITTVINQRNQFNLPFEVIALSTSTVARYVASKDDHECHFKDLDSLYQVLIAELICKYGELACIAAKMPYAPRLVNKLSGTGGGLRATAARRAAAEEGTTVKELFASVKASTLQLNINPAVLAALKAPAYKRGDFIKGHCGPFAKGSIGEYYLNSVNNGYSFVKPLARLNFTDVNVIYAHLLYFIDCVENMMMVILPVSLADFNIELFKTRFEVLMDEIRTVQGELLELILLKNNPDNNENPNLEIIQDFALDVYVSRIQILLTTCLDERLEALKKEYDKRSIELQALINFMNYFKKHPGMEHKAGVPKGGTFILVYHETPPRKKFTPKTDFVAAMVPGITLLKDQPELSIVGPKINELTKAAFARDPQLVKQFEVALTKYLDICRDMDDKTKDEITDILINIPTATVPDRFQIPEFSVIADFYLPYLCCSDCSPIAFVVPKETEEALSIRIRPTEFCNNDQNVYPVTVTPAGGELTASKGGVEPGTTEFRPNGLKAGVNTLTYTAKDGRKTSIDVKIFKAFDLDIKFTVSKEDGVTVQFSSSAPADGKATWDFGDGETSTELSPKHTYKLKEEQQTFTVRLTVSDGPCQATDEDVITLKRPVTGKFNLEPRLFCANDKREYTFETEPLAKVSDITNNDQLVLGKNAATGKVSFVPVKQKLTDTKSFHLEYQSIGVDLKIVVPDARFTMNLVSVLDAAARPVDVRFSAKAKKPADVYAWVIKVDGQNTPIQFSTPDIELLYSKFNLSSDNRYLITLAVDNRIPGVKCADQKEFQMRIEVFRKFLDRGDFDNDTVV